MQTSYFAKIKKINFSNPVCIARSAPPGYRGRYYIKLAPPIDLLKRYKNGEIDTNSYTIEYQARVLDQLNPQTVFNELGENATLLCWEGPDKFCHRHLAATWLKNKLSIEISEFF